MSAFKALSRGNRRGRSSFFPVAAALCLVLIALLTVAQVAHLHSTATDADHCPLCIVMHTAAPVAVAAPVIVIVQLGPSAPLAEPIVIARQPQSRLFIRPPPIPC